MAEAGNKFRSLRRALGLSQDDMGKIVGVTRATVYNWEDSEPNYTEQICRGLLDVGINPLYIYGNGDMILSGQTLTEVQDKIRKALAA